MRSGSIWLEIGVSLGHCMYVSRDLPQDAGRRDSIVAGSKNGSRKLEYVAAKAIGRYYTFRVRYSESSKGRIAILADRYSLGDLKIGGFLRECQSVFAATEDEAEKR